MYLLPYRSEWSVSRDKVLECQWPEMCGGHCDVPRFLLAGLSRVCPLPCTLPVQLPASSCALLLGSYPTGQLWKGTVFLLCLYTACTIGLWSVVPRWCKVTNTEKMVTDFKLTFVFVAFTCYLKTTCADFNTSCLWYLHVMHLIQINYFQFHVLLHYHHVFVLVFVLGAGAATVSALWLSCPKCLFRTKSKWWATSKGFFCISVMFSFRCLLSLCCYKFAIIYPLLHTLSTPLAVVQQYLLVCFWCGCNRRIKSQHAVFC